VGLGYASKCAFGDGFNCSNYSTTQKNLIKLALVLIWIGIAVSVYSIVSKGYKAANGTRTKG